MSKTATICAVKTSNLPRGEGFGVLTPKEVSDFWDPHVWAGPRQVLEEDTSFKQIIPYVIINTPDGYMTYTRGTAGAEGRLHDLVSIGIGGHVDVADAVLDKDGSINFMDTVFAGARRELQEEIGVTPPPGDILVIGLIQSMDAPVDSVHLGVVMIWDATAFLENGGKFCFEETMELPRFFTKRQLKMGNSDLESWTQKVLVLL